MEQNMDEKWTKKEMATDETTKKENNKEEEEEVLKKKEEEEQKKYDARDTAITSGDEDSMEPKDANMELAEEKIAEAVAAGTKKIIQNRKKKRKQQQ